MFNTISLSDQDKKLIMLNAEERHAHEYPDVAFYFTNVSPGTTWQDIVDAEIGGTDPGDPDADALPTEFKFIEQLSGEGHPTIYQIEADSTGADYAIYYDANLTIEVSLTDEVEETHIYFWSYC